MPPLPTGTVTFLFTDIEGSTQLWERHPEAMRAALARHDAILRCAVETHGGAVFKTVGDACYAAFATAPGALAATLNAQRTLVAEPWGATGPLRVRMALHTGTTDERDGDYFGPPLNRLARLLATGHGGQVLLSDATQPLVRDSLPTAVSLRDLGTHRLKDLTQPEHIYQVIAPDLPTEFPPLRSLDVHPHNLPVHPTPLIGREREVAAMRALLQRDDVRLVTLTGPGGTGKTRLALQTAADLLDVFADGVFFVNLAPVSDPSRTTATIAQALGVREATGQPLLEILKDYLRDKDLLLMLDNFEQVLEAAPVVAELLAAAPRLQVMVTSRTVLRLRGEHEFPVSPLAFPDPARLPPLKTLSQYAAVALFIQRAQETRPNFAVTNENALAVAEICHRLDGLPLALELAAARVKILTPQAMLPRLGHRLKLLTGGPRDLPARQQTLRAAIAWSQDLLSPDEQTLFRRLAMFAGGCMLEAAEAVCDVESDLEIDVLDGVTSLVDKSLLRREDGADGEPRFAMLATIREYAREQLTASGEEEAVARRHAGFFVTLAETADRELPGASRDAWLRRLDAERDNLRAALAWSRAAADGGETELRLAGALARYWTSQGYLDEGWDWLAHTLGRSAATARTPARARALFGLGWLARNDSDYAMAHPLLEESAAIWQEVGDDSRRAYALLALANIQLAQGDPAAARAFVAEALALFQRVGDHSDRGWALLTLGQAESAAGDDRAARAAYEASAAELRAVDNTSMLAMVQRLRGYLEQRQGDVGRALMLFAESLTLNQRTSEERAVAACLAALGGLATAQGQHELAVRLLAAAAARLDAAGATRLLRVDQDVYERSLAASRAALSEEAFEAAWAAGRALAPERAIAEALEVAAPRAGSAPHRRPA